MDMTTLNHAWARRATVRELRELREALQRGDVTAEHVRGLLSVLRNRADRMPEKFTALLDTIVAESGLRVRPPREPRNETVPTVPRYYSPVFLRVPEPRD
jgi:hypothetical protein